MKNAIRLACLALLCVPSLVFAGELPYLLNGKINPALWYTSNGWTNGSIQNCEWLAKNIAVDGSGVKVTLSKDGNPKIAPYGCGELQSMSKQGYGAYEARIKIAAGSGLNTSFFTYTGMPVHDEIDFEFLGKNPHAVQLNYFAAGKGGHEKVIDLGFDASAAFHDYMFVWTPGLITWFVDGKLVFRASGGAMPINPSRIYTSLWSGSSQINGWLGALNYTAPVSAEFDAVKFSPLLPNGEIQK